MKYEPIKCRHEKEGIPTNIILDDYHPLTKKQITELLTEALTSKNPSKQHVRLKQAVPGFKCPREISGKVAKLQAELDTIFVKFVDSGISESEYNRIFEICQAK